MDDVISGRKVACKELILVCKRYRADLLNANYDFRIDEAEYIIQMIETTIVLLSGEDANGIPFRGRPFLLQPWQKFIVYNVSGFYKAGTNLRRFTEAFLFVPRKNGKTPFASSLAWALANRYAESASQVFLSSPTLKQSLFTFNFIKENLREMGVLETFRVRDNNQEHSIMGDVSAGKIDISAFSGNADNLDGLVGNIVIADELAAYRTAKQYNIFKEATKGYRNKLIIGITTAGDDTTSFCFHRLQTCKKILDGTVKNEEYFVFICKADEKESGEVDYLDPVEHEKANPNYGITIMPDEIMKTALLARDEPQLRFNFLSKELNVYTASIKAFFDLEVFQRSDMAYQWTIDELAKLPIVWYGGVDLSKLHDLTAACLYGTYQGIDIVIPHAWFPVARAHQKAEEDSIPLFGWLDDGWLTMCNSETIHYDDVTKWFVEMRAKGFKIKKTRYDIRFGEQFENDMKSQKFAIEDQPQFYVKTTQGFNRIHNQALEGKFYYCHSEAFEYCLQNVKADEKTGGFYQFDKIEENLRIDIFAATVFAAVGMLENTAKQKRAGRKYGENRTSKDQGGD